MSTAYQQDNSWATILDTHSEALDHLGAEFGEAEPDPVVLYRFLKAFAFDLDQAKAHIRPALEYKHRIDYAGLAKTIEHKSMAEYPFYKRMRAFFWEEDAYSQDKHGNPVSISSLERLDPVAFMGTVSQAQCTEFIKYTLVKKMHGMAQSSRARGWVVREFRIVDLDGLSLSHLSPELLVYLSNILSPAQANFPEHLYKCYIINAPRIFSMGWAVIKSVLSERTQNKIAIMSTDYQATLLEEIAAEHLPVRYGGQCQRPLFEDPYKDFTVVVVDAGKNCVVEVDTHGRKCEWEFRTKSKDIGFSVRACDDWLVSPTRVESYKVVQFGEYSGAHPKLVFTWDNSFSNWSSKTVTYRITVHD